MTTTTMKIATSKKASSIKHANVLFFRSLNRARREVRSRERTRYPGCPGHGAIGLVGEYAGKRASTSVGCASSRGASAKPGGLLAVVCAGPGYVGLGVGEVIAEKLNR